MARLTWGARGQRLFEIGVDRGVLYPPTGSGVAWSGIVSVSENPDGGEPRAYYLDGVKYQNVSSAEEYQATINAFGSPVEFDPCDGKARIQNGLIVTNQQRKTFGLSYRTRLGNDVSREEYAYKIHLVYNALAAPSQRANATLGESNSPAGYSWDITTKPPAITGYKPTAHLVIDSSLTDPTVLSAVEDIVYGSVSTAPRLPTPNELITLFNS